MADAGPDPTSSTPPSSTPTTAAPPPSGAQASGAQASGAQASGAQASGKTRERIKEAYASSGPVLPDDTGEQPAARKSTTGEKFAAAMTVAKGAASSTAPAPATARRTRRARLRLSHIDPWSVMKTSFLLSVAMGVVTVVAVAVIWSVLGAAGVWDSIDSAVSDVVGTQSSEDAFAIQDYLGTSRVLGFTMLVAVVDVVLITVVATLGAFLYNLAAALLGGLEVTLAEEDH